MVDKYLFDFLFLQNTPSARVSNQYAIRVDPHISGRQAIKSNDQRPSSSNCNCDQYKHRIRKCVAIRKNPNEEIGFKN